MQEEKENKELQNKWIARENEISNWRQTELFKGFEMMRQHFHDLWD